MTNQNNIHKNQDKTFIFFVNVFLFSLPFVQAMTLDIGIPLKISEIVVLPLTFLVIKYYKDISVQSFYIFLLFLIWCLVVLVVNLNYEYDYVIQSNSRLAVGVDSIIKTAYLFFNFVALISCYIYFYKWRFNPKWLFYGTILACIYTIYLFVFSLLGMNYIKLPGMDEYPQYAHFYFGSFVRCGTFKEGNHLGLFLFVVFILAMNKKWYKTSLLIFISSLISASTVTYLCFIIAFSIYFLAWLKEKQQLKWLLPLSIIITSIGYTALQNDAVQQIVVEKLTSSSTNWRDPAAFSRADRDNSIIQGLRIAADNPFFGIGLSNYSLHFDYYNEIVVFQRKGFKYIVNNVYLEILAETGVLGFLIFISFYLKMYFNSKSLDLKVGLIGMAFCFIAYPTFTILFIWAFWAYIIANNQREKDKLAMQS